MKRNIDIIASTKELELVPPPLGDKSFKNGHRPMITDEIVEVTIVEDEDDHRSQPDVTRASTVKQLTEMSSVLVRELEV